MESYTAGLFDGDLSICIGRCNGGYQLKTEFSQCKKYINYILKDLFIKQYEDIRDYKYNNVNCISYRSCGKKCIKILDLMKEYSIIKYYQAEIGLKFIPLINKENSDKKELLCQNMKNANKNKKSYSKPYDRLNAEYIAGLFDAEGCVCITNKTWYIQIVQTSDPVLLDKITEYLGYGNQKSGLGRWRFSNINHFLNFKERIGKHLIIKKHDLDKLRKHLFNVDKIKLHSYNLFK